MRWGVRAECIMQNAECRMGERAVEGAGPYGGTERSKWVGARREYIPTLQRGSLVGGGKPPPYGCGGGCGPSGRPVPTGAVRVNAECRMGRVLSPSQKSEIFASPLPEGAKAAPPQRKRIATARWASQ